MPSNLELAVNAAMEQRHAAMTRYAAAHPFSMGIDAKRHAAWSEYGFKEEITYSDLYKLYRRGGIAHGAIEKIVGTCWRTPPVIIEGTEDERAEKETAWERAIKKQFDNRFWRTISECDRRRLIGRYAGLLIHVKDNQPWEKPVTKGTAIEKFSPVWAGALTPKDFDENPDSETYGLPTWWEYKERINGKTINRKIHADRIFIFGDYSEDAIAFLEPSYNAFVSLEKVEGGSGESFLKNAARQLAISFDKEIDFRSLAATYDCDVTELREKFNEATAEMNRGNDVMMALQGATVNPLVTTVADPSATYDVNLQTAAAGIDIPTRILVGNQQGERASTEDLRYFNNRCMTRREEIGGEIEILFRKLADLRLIAMPIDISVIWDDLNAMTKAEMLEAAHKMAQINQACLATGEQIFDGEEIREAAGYEGPTQEVELEDEDDEDEGKENNQKDSAVRNNAK
nr:MAG TPA: portal [Caudoviricetes sp.]